MMGALRRCLGCTRLGQWDRTGRCDECRRELVNAREQRPDRAAHKAARYDGTHRRLRRWWLPFVKAGTVRCARCRKIIQPGEAWDLDHLQNGYRHPSHAAHNRGARANAGGR